MPRSRLRHALAAACVLTVTMLAHPVIVLAQEPKVGEMPHLLVSGYGEVAIAPDRATIDVAVETRAPTASAAASQNARRLRIVLDTLKARGVATGDVATLGYSVSPYYEPQPRAEPVRSGYVATNVVRIETKSLDKVGALLDAALSAGANRVDQVRFGSSQQLLMRDSATALAIANARRTAERMARAAGGELGRLLELSTEMNPGVMRENMMRNRLAYAGGAMMTNQTSIAPDELIVNAMIVARWQLIGGR